MNCINEAISTNESPFSLFDQSKAKAFLQRHFYFQTYESTC